MKKFDFKKFNMRFFKVINIIINSFIGLVALVNMMTYGIDRYLYSDDWVRIIWVVAMTIVINGVDYVIQKKLKDF